MYRLAGRNGLLVSLLSIVGVMLRLPMPPRSSWILLWFLLTASLSCAFCIADVTEFRSVHLQQQLRVAIYGAGEAGAQLAAALRLAGTTKSSRF